MSTLKEKIILMKINKKKFESKCNFIRAKSFDLALKAQKGHIPSVFSWIEIAVFIFYSGVFNYNFNDKKRDRFILSKGHAALSYYVILNDLAVINDEILLSYGDSGSILSGHPDNEIPGVETCTGSLGHGFGIACGFSLFSKIKKIKNKHFVVLGDGECQEGSVWEAFLFAGNNMLSNLFVFIDYNGLGATDYLVNYGNLDPIISKIKSFGWNVKILNPYDFKQWQTIYSYIFDYSDNKPVCFICKTTKGKGVDFMENSKNWHHQMPNNEQVIAAMKQLKKND